MYNSKFQSINCIRAIIFCTLVQSGVFHATHNNKLTLIPSEFNQERGDSKFLEYLFKKDYSMLVSDHQEHPYVEGKGTEVFKNWISDKQINGRILVKDNIPLSFVIYFIADDNKREHLQDGDGVMPLMGVHPDFRRLGCGKMTMHYVMSWFREKNCQQAWLSVNKNNNAAQILYKKCGFINTGKQSWGESYWWVLPLSLSYRILYMAKQNQLNNAHFKFQ